MRRLRADETCALLPWWPEIGQSSLFVNNTAAQHLRKGKIAFPAQTLKLHGVPARRILSLTLSNKR